MFLFSFVSRYFLIYFVTSLTHWVFKSVLFNFVQFVIFPVFHLLFLVSFHCNWKIVCMISIFRGLLILVLWPNIWSILENVQCTLEKNGYPAVVGWSVLYISARSGWSTVFVVQILYFLIDLLFGCSIHYWKCALFWLLFVWNIFFHPFTFNLCVSLDLKWVSWRQHKLHFSAPEFVYCNFYFFVDILIFLIYCFPDFT